jgi:glycosyltransferase involved in cell wall biosynthesis
MPKKRLCYVVHRYGFPGGSEYYVQAMAEESLKRGFDVTVFTGDSNRILTDDYVSENGIKVTTDMNIFSGQNPFDLIIVHGADVAVQNMVLQNAERIHAPILYLIILPSSSSSAISGLNHAKFIGCSTQSDWNHIRSNAAWLRKAVSVRHSIPDSSPDYQTIGTPGRFREKLGISTPYMFLSSGGFWSHKGMHELVDTFDALERNDITLILTGYMNAEQAPRSHGNVKSFIIQNRSDVMDALADADLYIMNSTQEGFGLVLLESMLNRTPWASRKIAGAVELQQWGFTYTDIGQLKEYMSTFPDVKEVPHSPEFLQFGKEYVLGHRMIKNTVDDIEKCLQNT